MDRPNIQDIYQRVKGDLSSLDLRYSVKRVLSHAITGTAHMLGGYAEHLANLARPDSQDEKTLLAWCALYGIKREEATKAEITISVDVTSSVYLPLGTKWTHETGIVFSLKSSSYAYESNELVLVCETAGKAGNVEPGDTMTVSSTIPYLRSEAKVTQLNVEAFDIEPLDRLRSRLRERMRRPSQGGSPNDYINWALEYPAAARAWVLPRHDENGVEKNGHVSVTFFKESGLPTDHERIELQQQIKIKCPVSATPHVVPIKTKRLMLTLELEHDGSLSDEQIKSKLAGEIGFMLNRVAAPKGYLNKKLEKETGTVYLSDISRAISLIPEVINHRIISPSDHVEPSETGQIIVLGEVSF